jgi:hypothetical protein
MSQTSNPIPITGEELACIGRNLEKVTAGARSVVFPICFDPGTSLYEPGEIIRPVNLLSYTLAVERIAFMERGPGFKQQLVVDAFRLSDFVIVTPEAARAWRKLRCGS